MNVAVTGATGFLGARLLARLKDANHSVLAVGRRAPSGVPFRAWDIAKQPMSSGALDGIDAVIHLAGEPVAQRWSSDVKRRILESRERGTRNLVEGIADAKSKPRVLVSASAIGYYGDRAEEILDESSAPGTGFLPEVCVQWEQEASRAEEYGVRVATIRIGIVLGPDGGALKEMSTPFRLGVGGPLAGGAQWMSWIHVDDIVSLFLFALTGDHVSGALNGTAPEPIRNRDFTSELGHAVNRPAVIPVPGLALHLLFGEMAGVMLASQRVIPEVTLRSGFRHKFTSLRETLASVV